jgi:hypothetical protein
MKKIKDIGLKRALLSEIYKFRNLAVRALDEDDESKYIESIAKMEAAVEDLMVI